MYPCHPSHTLAMSQGFQFAYPCYNFYFIYVASLIPLRYPVRYELVTIGILLEYCKLGKIEHAISCSPNSSLAECIYRCGLNLEYCLLSQQIDTGYVYIYKKAESVSGLPILIGSNLSDYGSTYNSAIALLPLNWIASQPPIFANPILSMCNLTLLL